MQRSDTAEPAVNERGELIGPAAEAPPPKPMGPVNDRGELLTTPVHGKTGEVAAAAAAQHGQPSALGPVNERGELLSTPVAPRAVAPVGVEADEPIIEGTDLLPMPGVGEPVKYFLRPGEFKSGRAEFPAFVVKRDIQARTVDLVVFFDALDYTDATRVAERRHGERGFERILPPGLLRSWNALMGRIRAPVMVAEELADFDPGKPGNIQWLKGASLQGREDLPGVPVREVEALPPLADPLDEQTINRVQRMIDETVNARIAKAFGPFELPEGGFCQAHNELEERVEALEKKAKPAKRRKRSAAE